MDLTRLIETAGEVKKRVHKSLSAKGAGDKIYTGADGTATYRVDDEAEKAVLESLKGESLAVLSEEAGWVFLDKDPDHILVLDPLDGSTNAVRGIPFYCTSMALAPFSHNARLEHVTAGVVMNLVTGDIFSAEKNKGAFFNASPIATSNKTGSDLTASLYLGGNYDVAASFSKVRAFGAVALELSLLAKGSIELLYDNRGILKVTDVAAGNIIINEAGGVSTDHKGYPINPSITRLERVSLLCTGSRELHTQFLEKGVDK